MTDYKIGDEMWWFEFRTQSKCTRGMLYNKTDSLELLHDQIKDIQGDYLIGWHTRRHKDNIFGKSRKEAWETLKKQMEKWGPVE